MGDGDKATERHIVAARVAGPEPETEEVETKADIAEYAEDMADGRDCDCVGGDGGCDVDESADTHAAAASARPEDGLVDDGGRSSGDDDNDESSGGRDAKSIMVNLSTNAAVVACCTSPAADSPVITIACTRITPGHLSCVATCAVTSV